MRITNVQRGCDTGMYMVEVALETPGEAALDHAAVSAALRPLFAAAGIDPEDVVDVFVTRPTNGDA